jgi:hypothetical protein
MIATLPMGGVALSIGYDDMREVLPSNQRSVFGEEYAVGVMITMKFLSAVIEERGLFELLAYVVEDGHKGAAKAKSLFEAVKQFPLTDPRRMHVWSDTWVGKEEITTHAADLMSFIWASDYGAAIDGETVSRLRRSGNFLFKHYRREAIENAVENNKELLKQVSFARSAARKERKKRRSE